MQIDSERAKQHKPSRIQFVSPCAKDRTRNLGVVGSSFPKSDVRLVKCWTKSFKIRLTVANYLDCFKHYLPLMRYWAYMVQDFAFLTHVFHVQPCPLDSISYREKRLQELREVGFCIYFSIRNLVGSHVPRRFQDVRGGSRMLEALLSNWLPAKMDQWSVSSSFSSWKVKVIYIYLFTKNVRILVVTIAPLHPGREITVRLSQQSQHTGRAAFMKLMEIRNPMFLPMLGGLGGIMRRTDRSFSH